MENQTHIASTLPPTNTYLEKLIRVYLGFVELFLALRFVVIFLALEGKFAEWILAMTQSLFIPFAQWTTSVPTGMLFTIDFGTLTGMLLYVLATEFLIIIFKVLVTVSARYTQNV